MSKQIVWDARASDVEDVGLFVSDSEALKGCLQHAYDNAEREPWGLEALDFKVIETQFLPRHYIGSWEGVTYMVYPRKVK